MHAIYLQAIDHLIHKTRAERKLPKANKQANSSSKKDKKIYIYFLIYFFSNNLLGIFQTLLVYC